MNTHPPYRIHHLNLNETLAMPQMDTINEGNYLVFWWNSFALGDLFLDPGTELTEAAYFEKLATAIQPAIQQYEQNSITEKPDWPQLLKARNTAAWQHRMQKVFASENARQIPKKVAVSVVICTRNRAASLKLCLDTLQKMPCQPEEIVIIDNARINTETEEVARNYSNIKYYQEPVPGLSYARNTGIKNATCPIIAFTDDDVLVSENWVYRVWETFNNTETMAFTGLVIASELQSETQQIFEKHWSFNRGYTDLKYDTAYFRKTLPKGPPVWKIGAGANMAFRKSIFEKAGLFDERLGAGASGCNEDSEMWYRILASGHTIHYNPRAIVFHEHRKEPEALKKQIFNYMRGHAAAALIQQKQTREAGYIRHLIYMLLFAYSRSIIKGFPNYQAQYKTLWVQIVGLISGVAFYYTNKKIT